MNFKKTHNFIKSKLLSLNTLECLSKLQLAIVLSTLIFGILIMPAIQINPDNFYYIYLGSMFENCDDSKLRDAYTVGIVLPGIFRILFLGVSKIFDYLISAIIFSKIMVCLFYALFSYLCIAGEKSQSNRVIKIILLIFLFYNWSPITDIGSLNAEYICVALLIFLNLQLYQYNYLKYQIYIISLILVTLLNTKIQAIPLIFALLLTSKVSVNEKIKLLCLFILLACLNYFILVQLNLASLLSIEKILHYIQIPAGESVSLKYILVENFKYLVDIFDKFKILFLCIITCLLLSLHGMKYEKIYARNFFILLFIAIFIIFLPNKRFTHYQIFLLLPLFLFIKYFKYDFFKICIKNPIFKFSFVALLFTVITCEISTEYKEFKMIYKFNNIAFYLNNLSIEKIIYPFPDDQIKILKHNIDFSGKGMFVNGWDYSIYTYLNSCRASDDYASLKGGLFSSENFYENILKKKYTYIIDTTFYSSLVKNDSKNSLLLNQSMQAKFAINYDMVYRTPNLYVLKIK